MDPAGIVAVYVPDGPSTASKRLPFRTRLTDVGLTSGSAQAAGTVMVRSDGLL